MQGSLRLHRDIRIEWDAFIKKPGRILPGRSARNCLAFREAGARPGLRKKGRCSRVGRSSGASPDVPSQSSRTRPEQTGISPPSYLDARFQAGLFTFYATSKRDLSCTPPRSRNNCDYLRMHNKNGCLFREQTPPTFSSPLLAFHFTITSQHRNIRHPSLAFGGRIPIFHMLAVYHTDDRPDASPQPQRAPLRLASKSCWLHLLGQIQR